jgi:hypothetical protein
VALPKLTPEQSAAALERAREVRKARHDLRVSLKGGGMTLAELIDSAAASDVAGKMKVTAVLESLPGIGKVRAKQVMERLGIDEKRRLRGLGSSQRAALLEEFGADAGEFVPAGA